MEERAEASGAVVVPVQPACEVISGPGVAEPFEEFLGDAIHLERPDPVRPRPLHQQKERMFRFVATVEHGRVYAEGSEQVRDMRNVAKDGGTGAQPVRRGRARSAGGAGLAGPARRDGLVVGQARP